MRFKVIAEEFHVAVTITKALINKKSPILAEQYARVTAADTGIYVSTFNVAQATRASAFVPATVYEAGSVLLPPQELADLLQTSRGHALDFALDEQTLTMKITGDRWSANLKGLDPDEGVPFPNAPDSMERVDVEKFLGGLNAVTRSRANDDYRPVLEGFHFTEIDGEQSVITSDGYRLTIADCEYGPLAGLTLPPIISNSTKALNGEAIAIGVDENGYVHIHGDTFAICVDPLSHKFPDVSSLTKQINAPRVKIPLDEFRPAVKRVVIASNSVAHRADVRLLLEGDTVFMRMSASKEEANEVANIEEVLTGDMPVEESGKHFSINVRFIQDLIESVKHGTQTIGFSVDGPSKPVVFWAEDAVNTRTMVMPMTVKE
jgi:DNA polymerase III sliding clamp (beta) subunit (PCNA family)